MTRSKIHIAEPELDAVVNGVDDWRGVHNSERTGAYIIAVSTPFSEGHVLGISLMSRRRHSR